MNAGAQAATIQIQYVNQPKPGKKMGSLRDVNGQYWNIDPSFLHLFAKDQTADILYEQIGTFIKVVGANGQLFPTAPVQPQPGAGQPQTAAQVWKAPLAPKSAVATQTPTQPPPSFGNTDKEECMFIMGVVGRAMGSGQFIAEQIPELTRIAAYAWRTRHEPAQSVDTVDRSPGNAARNPDMTGIPVDGPLIDPQDPGWS